MKKLSAKNSLWAKNFQLPRKSKFAYACTAIWVTQAPQKRPHNARIEKRFLRKGLLEMHFLLFTRKSFRQKCTTIRVHTNRYGGCKIGKIALHKRVVENEKNKFFANPFVLFYNSCHRNKRAIFVIDR